MKSIKAKVILVLIIIFLITIDFTYAEQKLTHVSIVKLDLSFVDPNWDGRIIPKGKQCQEFGGNGSSPRILVKNIPNTTNKLIIEFSDGTYLPCDNGGHGIVSFKIQKGSKKIIVPSIPGQTFDLPENFDLIKEHCGANLDMKRGAYIGPCPGRGNQYYLVIKAVYQATDTKNHTILGEGTLEMGTYK